MPKQITITKEMLGDTAFSLVRESGIGELSARNLANRLKCSTQPIYKAYGNMDKLKENVMRSLADFMMKSIIGYRKTDSAFLDSGLGYINFAKTEKILFQLFCLENDSHNILQSDIGNNEVRELMEKELTDWKLSKDSMDKIFLQTMIFTYGLAVLAFLDNVGLSEDETALLLKETFESYVNQELEDGDYEYHCDWRKS